MIEACFEVAELHGNDLIEGQEEDDFRQLLKVAVGATCDWSYYYVRAEKACVRM